MAIANLLGSNLFNLLILGILDPFFERGPLLGNVSALHASSAFSMIIMSGAAIAALLYRPADRLIRSIGWISLFLLALYGVNSYVLFRYGE
jgi:cation:H+ antiporter